MKQLIIACGLAIVAWPATGHCQSIQHGLRVPAGFEVVEYADSHLANDIYCLTIDPKGRVVVAGRGYIRILVDDNDDGKADRAIEFASEPKDGAMGLCWERDTLYVTGDGGLRAYVDRDGDGKADGPSKLIRAMKTGGEHAAHAIRRGPDGWLYVLCGNNTGIDKTYATLPTSPIKDPVAGCVLRFRPDLKDSEVVAHGFRNAYDMDFNPEGELFTFDSDNERCVSLPWYEPTRFYHVISGGHHGWLSPQRANFWRLPSYVPDVTPPVATLGRGSPTACICYRHAQFPKEYRGSFLLADWTFGKIWHLPLERKGASYTSQAQVFLEAAGDNGFAPTGMAVHPKTGDLFISIGGRGTRGAVYRVRYPRGLTKAIAIEAAKMTLLTRSLEWDPRLAVELPRLAESKDGLTQMRALQLGARFYLDFKSYEPIEAMIRASCGSNDRFVRQASLDLMREYVQSVRAPVAKLWREDQPRNNEIISLHLATLTTSKRRWSALFPPFDKMILDVPASALVDVARLVQIARGDVSTKEVRGTVFEGYSAPREPQLPYLGPSAELTPAQLSALLLNRFPSGNANADREILRTLAMLGAETPSDLPDRWTVNSNPLDNIHEMIVWARCSNTDRATERVATALLDLDRKITQRNMNRDSHWPLRIAELYAGLAERDAKLNAAMVSHPDFGRPDHALFTQAPGFDRAKAATIFLAKIQSDRDYAVNESVLTTLRALPAAQVNAVVRPLWGQAGHDGAILQLLARQPEAQDRARFVQGLASPQPSVLMASLQALETLPLRRDGEEVFGLLQAWKHAPEPQKELRAILRRRLLRLTRLPADSDEQAWNAWLVEHHSALAKRLTNPDGVDVAAWSKRLANLDWSKGDGDRGRAVFVKASCAACHSGNQATGPDLKGVTKRFSRQDVFTAILQPSRDVPARYQMTQVETRDGKHYQGVVIYDAVDSLILQTAATTTVRLAGSDVNSRRNVPTSLMPAGLLDRLSDEDIADLYAYLQQG